MQTAKETLQKFMVEMTNYDLKWNKILEDNDYLISDKQEYEQLKDITDIQEKYLSTKALSINQQRPIVKDVTDPPEYQQDIVDEIEVNQKTIEITIQEEDTGNQTKITLILEKNEWKLDKLAYSFENWKVHRNSF